MKTTTETATILLVSENPALIDSTRSTLRHENSLSLIDKDLTWENLFSTITETHPDVILLDFEFHPKPFDLIDRIASEFPSSAVVAILSEPEMSNLDRVVLSGARAFIQYPYPPEKLIVTIKRVIELLERNQKHGPQAATTEQEDTSSPKTLIVFSPKGGAGTTTIATNLAISLHKRLKEDVLLIDGKHLFGHVALYLNLLTGNSITDLLAHASMLDQQLIRQVVVRHKSGIHVLPSPTSISEAQGIKPEGLFMVIQGLQQVYKNIIIDGGNHLDDNSVTYMDASDKILLVLNPDLASMRDIRQFMEISATLSYPKDKSLLILNQIGRKADVKREEIEKILQMRVFGTIPADENFALSCLNEGVPILMKKSRHPISKAIAEIADDLIDKIIRSTETE